MNKQASKRVPLFAHQYSVLHLLSARSGDEAGSETGCHLFQQAPPYLIHGELNSTCMLVQWPCRKQCRDLRGRTPELRGAGIWVSLPGRIRRWLQTSAGDCCRIWSVPGVPGLPQSRARTDVPGGSRAEPLPGKLEIPFCFWKVASSHTSWVYCR